MRTLHARSSAALLLWAANACGAPADEPAPVSAAGTASAADGAAAAPGHAATAATPLARVDFGHLGDPCGSRGLPADCEPAAFCLYPRRAQCGRADDPGTCAARPRFCPDLYWPVCGCDARTYINECHAHAVGVSVERDGRCL
jgi:hypothetical protein